MIHWFRKPTDGDRRIPPFRERRPRFTADDIEVHLRHELMHWLRFSMTGESGDTIEQRRQTAASAAKIIVEKLTGKPR